MAVILFKKGTGNAQKFNEFGFEHSLGNGWCLTKEEALAPEEIQETKKVIEPPEEKHSPNTDKPSEFSEEMIRSMAAEAKIKNWRRKGIKRLKKELGHDTQS
jgi:hypothetical protein